MRNWKIAVLASLALCACRATDSTVASVAPSADADQVWAQRPSSPKHGDDRGASMPPGTVRTVDEPLRPIEGAPAGKVWLLEMYQNAVAEKDDLARRAAETTRERDAAIARTAELDKARADLAAKSAALESELAELRSKSLELARRLAESELARLQAEKSELDGGAHTGSDKP